MVTFSTKALPDRAGFALNLLEYILNATLPDNLALPQYSDAVKDLERTCSVEMQKLAMAFPDQFMVRNLFVCTIGYVLIAVTGCI
jgi:exportin-5